MAEEEGRLAVRDRFLACLVPVLLVAVALIAVVRYHHVDQSSWQGVGFGMFATYEYSPARSVQVMATVEGEVTRLTVPPDLEDRLERVLVAPGDRSTIALAEELRERTGAESLVLEVWGHDVEDTEGGFEVSLELIRRVEVR